LLDAAEAYARYDQAVEALMGGDPRAALAAIDDALTMLPGEDNFRFVRVGALLFSGAAEESNAEMARLVTDEPGWEQIAASFAAKRLGGT
jgi:hypothetical protein